MRIIFKQGRVEIWQVRETYGFDFYVYGITKNGDPRVCPSEGMARELAAGAL